MFIGNCCLLGWDHYFSTNYYLLQTFEHYFNLNFSQQTIDSLWRCLAVYLFYPYACRHLSSLPLTKSNKMLLFLLWAKYNLHYLASSAITPLIIYLLFNRSLNLQFSNFNSPANYVLMMIDSLTDTMLQKLDFYINYLTSWILK